MRTHEVPADCAKKPAPTPGAVGPLTRRPGSSCGTDYTRGRHDAGWVVATANFGGLTVGVTPKGGGILEGNLKPR